LRVQKGQFRGRHRLTALKETVGGAWGRPTKGEGEWVTLWEFYTERSDMHELSIGRGACA
jgi:hypothetical protein